MFTVSALVLTFSLFISCKADYITADALPHCSIIDSECLKGIYQHMMETVGETGVKESGILPLDPLPIQNVSLTILDGVTVKISEGAMEGMKNCAIKNFNIDWEKEKGYIRITCDVLFIKGQFVLSGENPKMIEIIDSEALNGQGKAQVKLDNTNMNINISIYFTKRDGEIYLKISNKNMKYTYDIGKAHFITEKIIIANTDLSQIVSSFLNDNWRKSMEQFGSVFVDKALELFIALVAKFCDEIPASKYIPGDLNPYLKH